MRIFDSKVYECPKCGEFLREHRRKCPYCGLQLISTNSLQSNDNLFYSNFRSSGRRVQTQQDGGSKMPQTPDVKHDLSKPRSAPADPEVFSSSRRMAANGGYTQQSAVEQEKEYTGIIEPLKNDTAYFSSGNRKHYGKDPMLKRTAVAPDEKEFYNSSLENERKKRELITNITDDHDSVENPYKASKLSEEEPIITEHSVEFIANTITEFRKHRFGAYIYNRLELLLAGMMMLSTILVIMDVLYDPEKKTLPLVLTYSMSLIVLSLETQKTCRRRLTLTISAITIMTSVGLMLFRSHLDYYVTAPELIILYGVVALLNVLSMWLTRAMSAYTVTWETYQSKGKPAVDTEPPEEIEIYKSNDSSTDDSTSKHETE